MKHKITRVIPTFLSIICVTSPYVSAQAQDAPFQVTDGLFDAAQKETMGLNYAPEAETFVGRKSE